VQVSGSEALAGPAGSVLSQSLRHTHTPCIGPGVSASSGQLRPDRAKRLGEVAHILFEFDHAARERMQADAGGVGGIVAWR
jgi:hypothetical protein